MRLTSALFFWALSGLLAAAHAEQPFKIYGSYFPPYFISHDDGNMSGIIVEILEGALDAAHIPYQIMPQMPWRRAQYEAIKEPYALVAPFARLPSREENWAWISPVLDEYLVALSRIGITAPVRLDDLGRMKAIGVIAGGASETLLREMGLSDRLEETVSNEVNMSKLLAGRLDVWVLQGYEAFWWLNLTEADKRQRINPAVTLSELPLWVATSKATSPADVAKVRAAVETFRASPRYAEILRNYSTIN